MFTQTVMRHEKAEKRKSPNDTNKLFVYLQLFERGKHTFAHYKIFQRRLFTIVFLASSYPQDLFQTWLFIQSWFDLIKRNQQKQFKQTKCAQKLGYSSTVSTNRTCIAYVNYDIIDTIIWILRTEYILKFFTNLEICQSYELKIYAQIRPCCDYYILHTQKLFF